MVQNNLCTNSYLLLLLITLTYIEDKKENVKWSLINIFKLLQVLYYGIFWQNNNVAMATFQDDQHW